MASPLRSDQMDKGARTYGGHFWYTLSSLLAVITVTTLLVAFLIFYGSARREIQLLTAAREGDLNRVERLLDQGTSVHVRDDWNTTPLMLAAGWGHLEIVKVLLNAGAEMDERSRFDRTPLMWAAGSGQCDTVHYLLEKGADPTLVDCNGDSAADRAAENGFTTIADQLRAIERDSVP